MRRAAMLLSFTSIVTIVAVMAWVIQPRVGAAGGGGAEKILEFRTMVGHDGFLNRTIICIPHENCALSVKSEARLFRKAGLLHYALNFWHNVDVTVDPTHTTPASNFPPHPAGLQ